MPRFYLENSDRKYILTVDVFGRADSTCFKSSSNPTGNSGGSQFVTDVLQRADSVINFKNYDRDGDRIVDAKRDDKIELDITPLISAWLKGEKVNRGFVLQTEFPEEQTKFSAKSNGGAKAELIIYYTEPEKK